MIGSIQPCRYCGMPTRLSVAEGLTAHEGYRPVCVSFSCIKSLVKDMFRNFGRGGEQKK